MSADIMKNKFSATRYYTYSLSTINYNRLIKVD